MPGARADKENPTERPVLTAAEVVALADHVEDNPVALAFTGPRAGRSGAATSGS
jgi:hypothetical protein